MQVLVGFWTARHTDLAALLVQLGQLLLVPDADLGHLLQQGIAAARVYSRAAGHRPLPHTLPL